MMKSVSWFTGVLLSLFILNSGASQVSAASYDYYVKDGGNGDGSESDPFGSITDAVDEAKSKGGKKIFVASGSYGAAFTLPKGVELVGSDTKAVIIKGLIRMEDKSKLTEMTAETGGILVLSNADVTISKVRVKNVLLVGIKGEEGNGTITIRNSVIEGSRKGMYLQKGNEIRIEDSEIINNREEGVDIRENVSGSIRKSEFRNNGESGIEVVLGNSDLSIFSNTFSGNGASGVATQFFRGVKKNGDVRIEGNVMNGNTNYGIDCKTPQGGLESKDYFLNSIRVGENKFSKNKAGEVSHRCRILTDEERIELDKKEAVTPYTTLSPEEFAERVQRDANARKEYEDVREADERKIVENILMQTEGFVARVETAEKEVGERSQALCFLIGKDFRKERSLQLTLAEGTALLDRLRRESAPLEFENNRRLADDALRLSSESFQALEVRRARPVCQFSLFSWLNKALSEKGEMKGLVSPDEMAMMSFYPASDEREILFLGNVGYDAEIRTEALKNGDDSFFTDIKDQLKSYDVVVAGSISPIIDEADPAPLQISFSPLPMPARFANILSAHNIRLIHLGKSPLFQAKGQAGYEKTTVSMLLSGVETFGGPKPLLPLVAERAEPVKTLTLGGISVAFVDYAESKTTDVEKSLLAVTEAKKEAKMVVVFLSFNRDLSLQLTEARKELARKFIEAGAGLVVGTGLSLPLPYASEVMDSGRVYYSLGDFWKGKTTSTDQRGIAVSLKIGADGQATFREKIVSSDGDGKITLTDKE